LKLFACVKHFVLLPFLYSKFELRIHPLSQPRPRPPLRIGNLNFLSHILITLQARGSVSDFSRTQIDSGDPAPFSRRKIVNILYLLLRLQFLMCLVTPFFDYLATLHIFVTSKTKASKLTRFLLFHSCFDTFSPRNWIESFQRFLVFIPHLEFKLTVCASFWSFYDICANIFFNFWK
jgi:hypothetical protein